MKQIWNDLKQTLKYKSLINELIERDLKVKYRRSFLGYLWSLLNPLLMMCVMAYVFSEVLKSSTPNYPLYLICGQTLWACFNESTNMAMYSIIQNAALIKKVYIPKFIFPVSRILSSFITLSFSLVAIIIVMVFTKSTFYLTALAFWIPIVFLLVFSSGIGMILSALSVFFRDITHLYGVLTLAWMYTTPIFYEIDILPEKVQHFLAYNPMYYYLDFFRSLVMYGKIPTLNNWLICIGSSLMAFIIGLLVFSKLQRKFILYI